MRFALALLLAVFAPPAVVASPAFFAHPGVASTCSAQSGVQTAALVELYTSESCSSCPPAERWLSSLGARGYAAGSVVPLALHVDYGDYIGWKDPSAKREFPGRQRKLTQLQKNALVYTPQVLLQGRDFRAWSTAAFDQALARINAQPARARIGLRIVSAKADALEVEASTALLGGADAATDAAPSLSLYLAAYENKLESRVSAGENRGRILAHNFVVLEWQGPFDLPAERGSGKRGPPGGQDAGLTLRRSLALLPTAVPERSGAVAFLQNRRTREVLQALMLPACPG
jgi:hypothetical protein